MGKRKPKSRANPSRGRGRGGLSGVRHSASSSAVNQRVNHVNSGEVRQTRAQRRAIAELTSAAGSSTSRNTDQNNQNNHGGDDGGNQADGIPQIQQPAAQNEEIQAGNQGPIQGGGEDGDRRRVINQPGESRSDISLPNSSVRNPISCSAMTTTSMSVAQNLAVCRQDNDAIVNSSAQNSGYNFQFHGSTSEIRNVSGCSSLGVGENDLLLSTNSQSITSFPQGVATLAGPHQFTSTVGASTLHNPSNVNQNACISGMNWGGLNVVSGGATQRSGSTLGSNTTTVPGGVHVSNVMNHSTVSNSLSMPHVGANSFPLMGHANYPVGISTSATQVPLASVGANLAGVSGGVSGIALSNTPMNTSNPLVSVCSGLGECLPQSIKTKIASSEFVDFGTILAKCEFQGREENEFALKVNNAGELLWKDTQTKVPVSSIHTWTSAFLVFAAIYLRAHPHRAQEMLKYCNIVRTAAARHSGFGWRKYDVQFRMRQHIQPHRSWAVIDGELWAMYVQTPCPAFSLSTSTQSSSRFVRGVGGARPRNFRWQRNTSFQPRTSSASSMPGRSLGTLWRQALSTSSCYEYNNTGCQRGQQCKFAHKCCNCGGKGHGAQSCKKGSQSK